MLSRSSLALISSLFAISSLAHAAPSTTAVWTREGGGAFDFAATSVGTAGDVNCDGYADLIIGSPQDDESTCGSSCGSSGSGTIEVFFGGPGKPTQPVNPFARPDWFTYTGSFDGNLGNSVAAGDVNGDGCDDVIATEHFPAFPTISPQKVHVFLGPLASISRPADSGMAPPDLPEWSAVLFQRVLPEIAGQSPTSVAAGDVNGDGIADVIVGQPEASNGQSEEGVVLVWLGNQNFASDPDGTPANADWMAQSDQAGAHLGESVASAFDFNRDGRDDILAGAPDYNGHGWAFVWLGSPVLESAVDGTPANKAWSLTLASPGSRLGQSVAAAGDFDGDGYGDILVGEPFHDAFNFYVDSGEALLVRGGSPLPASDSFSYYFGPTTSGGRLGTSVATAGDVNGDGYSDILLGEPELVLGPNQAGRVHLILGRPYPGFVTVFPPDAATYTEPNTINISTDKARYGSSVGTAGDWNGDGFSDVIVGAPWFGQSSWGKAFLYLGSSETLATTSQGILGSQANSGHGLGLGFAGDVNHDGFSDVVTGAPFYESEAAHDGEGRIFVTYGGSCGASCGPLEIILPGQREGNQAGANLGSSVTGAGDVNGDGFADVIAGAPGYDGEILCGTRPIVFCPVPDAGVAQLYLGSGAGLAVNPDLTLSSGTGFNDPGQASSQFGYSVAGAGDVNGDGYGDVLVGAPYYSTGSASDGRVYLYLGSSVGLSSIPAWSKTGNQANARFGIAVSTAGDVNGDGYSDVIIGADGYDGTGAAFVYLGQPGGLKASPVQTYSYGPGAGWSFGAAVSSAGDVNRDGFADIVIGGPTFIYVDDPQQVPTGIALVYHGGVDGPSPTQRQTLIPPAPSDAQRFGAGVAGAGDVNGDGYDDLIVGAHWFTGPAGFAQGKAYLYHGGPNGISSTIARTFEDCPTSFCDLGHDVAGGHDMNGDGFSDVVLAAFKSDLGASDGGDVYLHMGNGGLGSPLRPLQAAGFAGTPRALLGITPNVIEASMALHSPAGRGRVQLEVEIQPFGQEFDGLGTIKGLFFDNGIFGRDALYEVGSPGAIYHWRGRLRSRSPLFGRSRWVSLPGNAPREADYRIFADGDADGINNAADVCVFYAQTTQTDTDGDARGNECECGDQNGDGQNTVQDLIAINTAIFNPALATPLCDANNDGNCNVSDIVAVNIDIFSPTSSATCARQPVPGP